MVLVPLLATASSVTMMHQRLGELTWPEVDGRTVVLAVPVGSCEQHGPHLPLDTDTRIAVALADALSQRSHDPASGLPAVLVAPAVAVSASGEHAGFPGTLSIGTEVTERLLVELVRSADWAAGVVLVNGHGGNAAAVTRAVEQSRHDGRSVLSWWPRVPGGDAHAGRTETSLLLHLAPASVRLDRAVAGRTEPVRELIDELRAHGTRHVSPAGVLGDPTDATADEGARIAAQLTDDLCHCVLEWATATGVDR